MWREDCNKAGGAASGVGEGSVRERLGIRPKRVAVIMEDLPDISYSA